MQILTQYQQIHAHTCTYMHMQFRVASHDDSELRPSANPDAIKLFGINYTYYFTIIRYYISIIFYYFNYFISTVPTIIRYYSILATRTIIPIISWTIIPIILFR